MASGGGGWQWWRFGVEEEREGGADTASREREDRCGVRDKEEGSTRVRILGERGRRKN